MSWINSFVPMDKDITEGSSKRAGGEFEFDKSKKQKLDEKVEVEEDNDQEESEMKIYMKIISDDEIALDAIPLDTKPPIIVDWKIIKEGKINKRYPLTPATITEMLNRKLQADHWNKICYQLL
uniref:Uncharacterized protein n=1 Tax=Tanacetum cinerariifolium TaxID=118510 RepID=A0A699TDJ7_TANCI|nr:hypothetical protein [Tanacetum cinerariifolium]